MLHVPVLTRGGRALCASFSLLFLRETDPLCASFSPNSTHLRDTHGAHAVRDTHTGRHTRVVGRLPTYQHTQGGIYTPWEAYLGYTPPYIPWEAYLGYTALYIHRKAYPGYTPLLYTLGGIPELYTTVIYPGEAERPATRLPAPESRKVIPVSLLASTPP